MGLAASFGRGWVNWKLVIRATLNLQSVLADHG